MVGFVGETDVRGVAVGVGVDGDRGDAQLAGRPQDAHGDLAPVGDEQLIKLLYQQTVIP